MSLDERENYSPNDQYSQEDETRAENEDFDIAPLSSSLSNDDEQENDRFNQEDDYSYKENLDSNNQDEYDSNELDNEDRGRLDEDDESDSELESENDYTESDINQGL